MLTDPDFLTWLQARSIVVVNPASKDPFDSVTYNSVINGKLIAAIILELLDKASSPTAHLEIKGQLKNLPSDTKFLTKAHNWEVLHKAMQLLGLEIKEETKAMVAAGVTEEIVKVLCAVRELDDQVSLRGSNVKAHHHKIKLGPDGALFLESVNSGQHLQDTTYVLEFLLVSMSRAFCLKPKQAAVLMTRNGLYLAKVMCKGLRKQFIPVIEWLDCMLVHAEHLCFLIGKEIHNDAVSMVCELMLPGLLSKNEAVVAKLSEVFLSLIKTKGLSNQVRLWFNNERTCLNSCVVAYGRYPALADKLKELIFSFSQHQVESLLREQLPECFVKSGDYLRYIVEFYDYVMNIEDIHLQLLKGSLIDYWVTTSLKVLQDPSVFPLPIVELTCFLWGSFPHRIDEASAKAIFTGLQRLLRDKRLSVRVRGVCMMFHLVEVFASKKQLYAPVIYQALVAYYIESYNSFQVRHLMVANFPLLFARFEALPFAWLAEPILKHLRTTKCLKAEVTDVDLIFALARHPQLDSKTAVTLLAILGLISMSVPVFAKACSFPMVLICRGNLYNEAVQDTIVRFCKLGVQKLSQERSRRHFSSTRKLQVPSSTLKLTPSSSVSDFGRVLKSGMKGSFVLALAKDLFELKHSDLNSKLQRVLLDINTQHHVKTGKDFAPVTQLLSRYADHATLALLYSSLLSSSVALVPLYDSKAHQAKIRGEIRNTRQKWLTTTEAERRRTEESEAKRQRQRKLNYQKVELQMIKLGIPMDDDQKPLIFPFGSLSWEEGEVLLYEIRPEDQLHLQQVLCRYRRALQVVFKDNAFSLTEEVASEKLLTEGEHWTLLKEQSIADLSFEEFRKLLKKFCVKGNRPNSTLEFKGFVEFIVQVACFVFNKDHSPFADLPPPILVTRLMETFKTAFLSRGKSVLVFEETESPLIRTLNQRLREDPGYELPSNYIRCEELRLDVAYVLPDIGLSEGQSAALEVLDEVMSRSLNVHLLRPIVVETLLYYAKKIPHKLGIVGPVELPLEFSKVLKEGIIDRLELFDLERLIEVGHVLHSACERTVKDSKLCNRALQEHQEANAYKLEQRALLSQRIQQRGLELKAKIEEIKQAKAQTLQSEEAQQLAKL
jgi:hypothetical protein